jgi:hypothetical protein
MAEARRLKSGRWRLYKTPNLDPIRDPASGEIPSFQTLAEARRWWLRQHPREAPPHEGVKCARCGAYFAKSSSRTLYGGLYYHLAHVPEAIDAERRRRGQH